MILITKDEAKRLIRLMTTAEGYCRNAVSSSQCGPNDDATYSYAGASGYARATLREVIQTLESHVD